MHKYVVYRRVSTLREQGTAIASRLNGMGVDSGGWSARKVRSRSEVK